MRIGIDLLGSDCSPVILFEAVEKTIQSFPQVHLIVFVTPSILADILAIYPLYSSDKKRLEFQIVHDVIEMHDEPLRAYRQKKNSSIVMGIKLLKKHFIDGFVSCGNTGALIVGAALSLPLLHGIKRPALLATLPTESGDVIIIDVGGSVRCTAQYLVQFAHLGVGYQKCCCGIPNPRVGLLNIGNESKKGTNEIRQAYQELKKLHQHGKICFVGNVEGKTVFQGDVDVLVSDGFTGNVFLKASEGISMFILQKIHNTLQTLLPEKSAVLFHQLSQSFNYDEYSGAIVCGIEKVLIKCHGQSSPRAFFYGISRAIHLVRNECIQKLSQFCKDYSSLDYQLLQS